MKAKRFWGRDTSAALRAVRSALGADALISETKNLTTELGGGVEIIALGADGTDAEAERAVPTPTIETRRDSMEELRRELTLLKSMLGWLAPGLSHQHRLIESLVTHGVTPENIAKLLRAMEGAPAGGDDVRWCYALAQLMPRPAPLRARGEKLALVGPSGVGKTATLIKLTICESQRRECRIGWVSMDQPNLSANLGLDTYASILGVRLERAASRAELKIALGRLAECDLVLIDTPASNPRQDDSIAQLAKSLRGLGDLRAVLVLSAATNSADLIDWVKRYRPVGIDALLFTKLDECRYLGPLLNTVLSVTLPLSFITFGQSLAEDLAPAQPEWFANLVLTGVAHEFY